MDDKAHRTDTDDLATRVFEIYSTKDLAKQAELVNQVYAPKAVFSDNITHVSTVKEITLMFKGLALMFPSVDVQIHDVVKTQGDQTKVCARGGRHRAKNTLPQHHPPS